MLPPSELVDRFRSEGLKVTPQRELLFRLLYGNTSHPTADALFASAREVMPMISLKTVYQVLHDLHDLGEIQAIDLGTGSVRFDPKTDVHQHLLCNECGAIHDVVVPTDSLGIPRSQRRGFTVDSVDVTFRGRCGTCADRPSGAA
jgi:Fur family transcriptional regulator, stress-responsive regulator